MAEKSKKAPAKKKSNYYFTKDTENYIIKYQNSTSNHEKSRIYENHIHLAFTELVTNLITVYNYKSYGEEMEHFKSDCVVFLFETIHKWDVNKGTKAFSYFNVVAKNWLTIQSRRHYKNYKRNVDISDGDSLTKDEKDYLANNSTDYTELLDDRPEFIYAMFKAIHLIEKDVKQTKDKKCLEAIKFLFENISKLEFFNKRAIFVYLREISGLNSAELSCSLSRIRKVYKRHVGENKEVNFEDYKGIV